MNFDLKTLQLPLGLELLDLVAVTSAISMISVVVLVWYGLVERDPLAGRLRNLSRKRGEMKAGMLAKKQRKTVITRKSLMHFVVARFKLLRNKNQGALGRKLARAGWRGRDAVVTYLFAKLAMPILVGLFFTFFVYAILPESLPQVAKICILLATCLLSLYLPDIWVTNVAQRRQETIRKALPDAFDLLVICAEAGLSLDASLERVSKEIGESCPELTDELGLTAVELSFLPDRHKALSGLADRVPLAGLRALVNTLMQTERYGTPLADALRVLSHEMRHERMMKAEEKGARLPALLTLPMVVFILPPLFVVLVGPAALKMLDSFSTM
ncbi:type II secretion system F family protein [Rhodovibrionaceae bacterium A322]